MPQPTFQSLSPAAQRLVRMMQHLHFGRIENLRVTGGEPCFEPKPVQVRLHKFARANGGRGEAALADFPLKAEVSELVAEFERIGSGVIRSLTVQHGLPVAMEVEEVEEVAAV